MMHMPGKPQGNPGGIEDVARAFQDLASAVEAAEHELTTAVAKQFGGWSGMSRDSFDAVDAKLHDNMGDFASSLRSTAGKLNKYAGDLRSAQHKYDWIVGGMAVTGVVGIVLTIPTLGGSDVAAGAAETAEVGGVISTVAMITSELITALQGLIETLTLFYIQFPVVTVAAATALITGGLDLLDGDSPKSAGEDTVQTFVFSYVDGKAGEGGEEPEEAPVAATEAQQIAKTDDELYQNYLDRKAAENKTALGRDQWQSKVDTLRTNKIVGDAYRDEVAEYLGIKINKNGWTKEYTMRSLGRRYDLANEDETTAYEVKSGSTPVAEGLGQMNKDELAVSSGWTITWVLKTPLSPVLMERLEQLSAEYPGEFMYTIVGE